MKPKIIVYTHVHDELLENLRKTFRVSYYDSLTPPSGSAFIEDLKDAAGLVGSGLQVNSELLEQAPQLKVVSNISVGFNNLDIGELTKRSIMATNTPDVLTDTTADTIFALLMATARRIPELDRYVKDGKWQEKIDEQMFGMDVHHKVIGIIGMGRIGGALAERAHHGFKMKVLYHNRSRRLEMEEKLAARYCSMEELLEQSDFVCLMAPYTAETENLIEKAELELMKQSAILINGSRGTLVNEEELTDALSNKRISGAGLDVYREEPVDKDNPLLKLDNVVTLPHIGSATTETRYRMAELAIENVVAGVNGERPPNLINPEIF